MSSWPSGSTMLESLAFLMAKGLDKNLRLKKMYTCNLKSIVNEASTKLTKLRDFTPSSVSLAWRGGGGAYIKPGAFLKGGRLIYKLYTSRGAFIRYGAFI